MSSHTPSLATSSLAATTDAPSPGFPLEVTDEVRVIAPTTRRARLADLWRTLPLAGVLALRDFKARYKQSALGPIWLLAQPLGILAAFTVVFNGVTKIDTAGIPYTLFALVGITAWTFTSSSLSFAPRAFIGKSALITLMDAPRAVYATAGIMQVLPNMLAPLLMLFPAILLLGHHLTFQVLLLPICIGWLIAFCWLLMLLIGSVNVWYRDVASILPFLLQGGVFLTPVGYSIEHAPSTLAVLLAINPLTGIIEVWRWSLLGSPLDLYVVAIAAAWTAVLGVLSWQVFARLETKFADVI